MVGGSFVILESRRAPHGSDIISRFWDDVASFRRTCFRRQARRADNQGRNLPEKKVAVFSVSRSRAPERSLTTVHTPATFGEQPGRWRERARPFLETIRAWRANKVIMSLARRVAYCALLFRHSVPPPPQPRFILSVLVYEGRFARSVSSVAVLFGRSGDAPVRWRLP